MQGKSLVAFSFILFLSLQGGVWDVIERIQLRRLVNEWIARLKMCGKDKELRMEGKKLMK